jgi:hypothetical protein
VTALVGDSTPLAGFKVKSTFRLDEIVPELAGQPEEQLRTAQALLYSQGLVTFADNGRFDTLRVPNTVVRLSMFDVLVRKVQFSEIDALLRAPSAALLKQLLQEIVDKGPLESEADMQREVELVFNWLCRGRGLKSQLRTVGKKRADLVIEGADGVLVLEFKLVQRIKLLGSIPDNLQALTEAEVMNISTTAQWSSPTPLPSTAVRNIAHVVRAAQDQVALYEAELKQRLGTDRPVHSFAVVLVGDHLIVRHADDKPVMSRD